MSVCVLVSVIEVTAANVLLICSVGNNYTAPLVIALPVKFEGHKCNQQIQWRMFSHVHVRDFCANTFHDEVYASLSTSPRIFPCFLCGGVCRGSSSYLEGHYNIEIYLHHKNLHLKKTKN